MSVETSGKPHQVMALIGGAIMIRSLDLHFRFQKICHINNYQGFIENSVFLSETLYIIKT